MFRGLFRINAHHNFPPEIFSAEEAAGLLGMLFSHANFYTVLAELDGRSAIAGGGPITVDPAAQNQGVGRCRSGSRTRGRLRRRSTGPIGVPFEVVIAVFQAGVWGTLAVGGDSRPSHWDSAGELSDAVGESTADVIALISAAADIPAPVILVPMRNSQLFNWCRANGLRVVQPMNLMTLGLYNEPAGA